MKIGDMFITKTLTKEFQQGSEYGPDLRKYAVNPSPSEDLHTGTELIEYTNDLALLISDLLFVTVSRCFHK